MIIEYNSGRADKIIETDTLTIQRWFKKGETLIIHDLWEVCYLNSEETFEDLYYLLKLYYKHRTVKSKAEISKSENTIEITNRSVIFPNILILKK